jgi:light-regulated signal transduction histidine kinase (bacteriophytochrome)
MLQQGCLQLIRDVLSISQLSSQRDKFELVDLNTILHNVLTDYELLIEEKRCVVRVAEELPVVRGHTCPDEPVVQQPDLQRTKVFKTK